MPFCKKGGGAWPREEKRAAVLKQASLLDSFYLLQKNSLCPCQKIRIAIASPTNITQIILLYYTVRGCEQDLGNVYKLYYYNCMPFLSVHTYRIRVCMREQPLSVNQLPTNKNPTCSFGHLGGACQNCEKHNKKLGKVTWISRIPSAIPTQVVVVVVGDSNIVVWMPLSRVGQGGFFLPSPVNQAVSSPWGKAREREREMPFSPSSSCLQKCRCR